MVEGPAMLFREEFKDLFDDGFEGSIDEHRIFSEVFFQTESSNKEFTVMEAMNLDHDHIKQTEMPLCSNSGNSSLTSQDDNVKEEVSGTPLLECLLGDLTSPVKSNHELMLSVGHMPDVKPDLGALVMPSPSGVVISGISQQDSDSASQTLIYRLVESSSGQGVTSSCYQLERFLDLDKGCEISGGDISKIRLSYLDQTDQKESISRPVASPISQESYASKLGIHRLKKPRWKDSCFVKLDEDELTMPMDIKNDPRPLLRYHINRLLRASGWVIGRRKRKSRYNGVGGYIYKSPGGRPIREFHRTWCMCGESLLSDAINIIQTSDCIQWNDMTELWTDLSRTVREIEDKLNILDTSSAMAYLWCLLDPFANAVFIEKTIRLLKKGTTVKAKRSTVITLDARSAAKHMKLSTPERSFVNPGPLQEFEYGSTYNQISENLFDVPIDSGHEPKLLGGIETVIPIQGSSKSSPSFDHGKSEEEGGFGYLMNPHKKSRKLSEMELTGETANCPLSKISSVRRGSKKSKKCRLNDDDLLISAIMKTKTFKSTKKWSTRKPKPLRKRKTLKGSCRLLPRSLKKGAKYIIEKWSTSGPRTVLSWLIHSGAVSLSEVIQYRNLKDDFVIKDGLITRDGILCKCCNKELSISGFKSHAGFCLNRPCMNLFMGSGKPLTLCQLEAWSAEYKARKVATPTDLVNDVDQNDDSCGRCGDVGELICCDSCPSAFHQACLFEQELPEGSWFCPQCRCQICGDAVNKETSQPQGVSNCSQCDNKYHNTCMQGKGIKVGLTSETWFCGESCQKVYSGLQDHIGLNNLLSDSFCWTLLRCIPGDQIHSAQRSVALKAECNSKLAVAITIMEECFLPMVDTKTGIDMIPQVIYNWESQLARLNYNGFYTVILEKDDVILSVACIRIHGVTVAELPLIATCSKNRRQGMCRRLINSIEEMLKSLKVEKLVVSAIPSLVETWTSGFGFLPLEEDERRSLSKINLMVFPGSVWLKKQLYENPAVAEEIGTINGESSENVVSGENEDCDALLNQRLKIDQQKCEELVDCNLSYDVQDCRIFHDPASSDEVVLQCQFV
ncbi:hypothetical protein BUALT_Bualt03G0145300 [Buddleja alternifolia]|uniref:Uncharacterized protein n=1 Tax=Buddleja alternifolia TaxID=168488 RepID=A0AAV6Y133_9LAMI|nr:hypothetical protein BUALT_Bualt03G0145300 [Buddleja alternifolia]